MARYGPASRPASNVSNLGNGRPIRFGVFEVDLHTGELRKQGVRIKLRDQPFQILLLLLTRPGEVVSRDELQKQLWPGDTFVDFDRGLNKAPSATRRKLPASSKHCPSAATGSSRWWTPALPTATVSSRPRRRRKPCLNGRNFGRKRNRLVWAGQPSA